MKTNWCVLCGLISLGLVTALPARSAPAVTDAEIAQACGAGPAAGIAMLPERMPEIPADKLTEAQKKVASEFLKARGRAIYGPWLAIMRSPEVALRGRPLGDYLRNETVLPPMLRDFVVILTAREWTSEYIWFITCPTVLKEGLSPNLAKAVAEGRRPAGMSDDEDIIYSVIDELDRNRSVSDPTYARAVARFGEQGIVDMVGVNGYFSFIAMESNMARTALPEGAAPALARFPR
jgi:4-carboxymuconolactone decarboxylase